MGNSRFTLRSDHVDNQRGVVIDIKPTWEIVIHVCLRGNPEEYVQQEQNISRLFSPSVNQNFFFDIYFFLRRVENWTRRFYLQKKRDQPWQPCFSAMHMSIQTLKHNWNTIQSCLFAFIQFFNYHSIPIHLGSIAFSYKKYIHENNLCCPTETFIGQYAWHMLNHVGCRIHDQLVNDRTVNRSIFVLRNRNDDNMFYHLMERLRRLALSAENYFLQISKELPIISDHYHDFYLNSIFCQTDKNWTDYVRIPWFCLTPTRLIVKPPKFMRSNRVFRHVLNVNQCMAFVEFRDDNGSAYLPSNLVPFLKYYLQNGFHFGGRHYIYLHHAQSQIRHKQFYFYCEREGGMSREALEAWMGDFDSERLPAKNTARRTQPFSSTQATIEVR